MQRRGRSVTCHSEPVGPLLCAHRMPSELFHHSLIALLDSHLGFLVLDGSDQELPVAKFTSGLGPHGLHILRDEADLRAGIPWGRAVSTSGPTQRRLVGGA